MKITLKQFSGPAERLLNKIYFLSNLSASVVETVICRQNSRLYGVRAGER